MPEYCYTCRCGKSKGAIFPMGKAPKTKRCACGSRMQRDYTLEHGRMVVADYTGGKLWYDIACHPEDVAKEQKEFRDHGINVDIQPDGGFVCHSDKQRQAVLRSLGL